MPQPSAPSSRQQSICGVNSGGGGDQVSAIVAKLYNHWEIIFDNIRFSVEHVRNKRLDCIYDVWLFTPSRYEHGTAQTMKDTEPFLQSSDLIHSNL